MRVVVTPENETVLNDLDRFHLVMDTIDRLPPSTFGSWQASPQVPASPTIQRLALQVFCIRSLANPAFVYLLAEQPRGFTSACSLD
jgi:hypothetical protein